MTRLLIDMSVKCAVAFAILSCCAGTVASAQADAPVDITVHADQPIGPAGSELVGFGWNTASIEGVAPLAPHTVRIDARLESASTGPDALDLTDLLGRVAAVRGIGAEPIVILSYMPAWLAEPAFGRDASKVPPSDPDVWKALIKTVVRSLATAPAAAYRFEVWNEPDNPIFWQDLPSAFIDLAVLTHRAVAEVATETGLPLQIGGPASLVPDPIFTVPYVNAMKSNGLPLDFLSWHYYGNTPFFGPDGAEDILPPAVLPLYLVLGQPNPLTSPSIYSSQVEFMRALRDALIVGSDLHPTLVIDEWNLSAAGFDNRHDTNEGAAFAAGALIEMERSGLDASDFYRAASTVDPAHSGDWGVVDASGKRKPVWSVFDAWNHTGVTRLATDGDDPLAGLWARGSADGEVVNVLLAAWDPRGGAARAAVVHVPSACATGSADVRTIDATSPSFDRPSAVAIKGGAIALDLAPQSVTWISISADCAATSGVPEGDTRELADTGDPERVWVVIALVVVALVGRTVTARRRQLL